MINTHLVSAHVVSHYSYLSTLVCQNKWHLNASRVRVSLSLSHVHPPHVSYLKFSRITPYLISYHLSCVHIPYNIPFHTISHISPYFISYNILYFTIPYLHNSYCTAYHISGHIVKHLSCPSVYILNHHISYFTCLILGTV